jgi:hypothetical protein
MASAQRLQLAAVLTHHQQAPTPAAAHASTPKRNQIMSQQTRCMHLCQFAFRSQLLRQPLQITHNHSVINNAKQTPCRLTNTPLL